MTVEDLSMCHDDPYIVLVPGPITEIRTNSSKEMTK